MTTTRLPQVDRILREQCLVSLSDKFRRELLTQLVREELELLRQGANESQSESELDAGTIAQRVAQTAEQLLRPVLRKVINATGVVLNTNLGRAPLATTFLSDLIAVGGGYCNLEIDLKSGKRGKRSQNIERLLKLLTQAEAALVVNNNAAAVMLVVNALSRGKQVIVSRGELIEIGGSFRLPDVIEAGGSLREVGTTNRTRVNDFRKALGKETGLLMRCHRSNFEIRGFTENATLSELSQLSAESGVPFLEDLGSGILFDMKAAAGLGDEPTVKDVVASGCDLVSFSGDKLLGGPQAGFIVGKRKLVEVLQKHPMYRALRLDKLTLALVERTLIAYLSPEVQHKLPALASLTAPKEELQQRAESMSRTICDATNKLQCAVVSTRAAAGGGSLPEQEMDSFGVQLSANKLSSARLAEMLRGLDPPVIAIIQDDKLVLDFRTVSVEDQQILTQSLLQLAKRLA